MDKIENSASFSKNKYNTFLKTTNQHLENIKKSADIIYKLETCSDLSLHDRDLLKVDLGELVDSIKSDSESIVDTLVTEYQFYDAISPKTNQNLNGFKLLKEKVVLKEDNTRINTAEATEEDFYYRE